MSIASEAQFDQARVAERMRDIREATRVVSEGFSREYMRECIDNHRFPQEAWEALGEYGLLGITIPEDLGGSGGGRGLQAHVSARAGLPHRPRPPHKDARLRRFDLSGRLWGRCGG